MFTGIIQEQVTLKSLAWDSISASCRFSVDSKHPERKNWKLGDSIAFDGVCLTIISIEHAEISSRFAFDVSSETLAKTHFLKSFQSNAKRLTALHLEPALCLGDALGGHLVSGHVEAVGTLLSKQYKGDYLELNISIPKNISAFVIEKGSLALDGTSLTVNSLKDENGRSIVGIYMIPHTLEKCHFAMLEVGDEINIESDLLARHYARYQNRIGVSQ